MNHRTTVVLLQISFALLITGQSNAQMKDNSNALNKYSFDLYREVKVENENLLLSPLSTYYALLIAYEGSKSKTKQEFEKVLHLKNSGSSGKDYLYYLASNSDSCSGFRVSNAVWIDKNLQVEEGYKKAVSDNYLSDFKQTEFANKALAVSDINLWVAEKTNGRITEIVQAENINATTKLLISNAVYFKGEWLDKFEKRLTYPAPFFTSAENQFKVDFMNKKEILQYFENEEFQFISKPYKDSDLLFCVLLPKKLFGIEAIERKMDNDFFAKILDSTHYIKTSVSLPKIKLESSYELGDALKNAGLTSAFTLEANFSGITKEKPVMLEKVLHKTWIELDEEKTEAAAATATTIMIGSATRDAYKVFKADLPLCFSLLTITPKQYYLWEDMLNLPRARRLQKIKKTWKIDWNIEKRRNLQ